MGSTKTIEEVFAASIARRTHKIDSPELPRALGAPVLIRRPGGRTEVIAGYPWHGVSGRQSFVALPGITLLQEHKEDCIDVLDTEVRNMRDGMFAATASAAVAADAPLWFFWTLQRLGGTIGDEGVEPLRRGHEGRCSKPTAGVSRTGRPARQRARMGVVRRDSPDVDELHDRRPARHAAQRLSGRGQRLVVQRRPLHARNWRAVRATKPSSRRGRLFRAHRERIPGAVRPARRLSGRLRGRDGANKSIRPNMILACSLPYKPAR